MTDANAPPIGAGYLPLPATFDPSRRSQEHTKTHRSVIAFLAVALIALTGTCMYLDISLEQVTAQLKAATMQLSAANKGSKHTDACVARAHDPQCIKTPAEYIKLLTERAKSHEALNRTACVADNMLGRMYTGAFKGDDWELDPVLSNAPARRIIFAIGPRMLEKILVWGHNAADKAVKSLGYGDAFVCGGAPDYKASCQYRLLVWTSECTVENEGPLVRGDWANLEAFMREDYGKELPKLTRQIAELEAKTFCELTQCDPDVLQVKAWDPAQQVKAGCSPEYIAALAKFPFKACNDSNPQFTKFTKCPAEEALLHGGSPPTTLELRAFLQQTQGFMPQYTGYSYTANEYDDPLSQEFWIHNDVRAHLANGVVAKLWNDTAEVVPHA
eukprot:TRINITY_DN17855_c0_g1_i1.p1 TRINITY_DN17855_c0_g1~~TRINITY_DN17855_c0_g1_i1.p1  ORF type:complete len:387 (+),score=114.20 TRINITY_DN17855_c0_g1_i1:281-1441(+)